MSSVVSVIATHSTNGHCSALKSSTDKLLSGSLGKHFLDQWSLLAKAYLHHYNKIDLSTPVFDAKIVVKK